MKILFIPTLGGNLWGGSEELWTRTCELALHQGHQCFILVKEKENVCPQIAELKNKGSVIIGRWTNKKKFSVKVRAKLNKLLNRYDHLLKKVSAYDFDLVCISQGNTFNLISDKELFFAATRVNKPVFIISQFNYEYKSLEYPGILAARQIFNKAKIIFFVSERNRQAAEMQIASSITNATIINNPIKLTPLSILDWPVNHTIQMAVVASLTCNHKGQHILIQVLSQKKWKDRPWQLNLYGKGKDEQYLKDLIRFYQLEEKICIVGFTEDVKKIWQENHILLLPSLNEGTPLALMEAIICGRPALITDVGGNTSLIQEGVSGFIAEAPTVPLIDRALERAWLQQDYWKKLGENAHYNLIRTIDLNPSQTLLSYMLEYNK